ncbi:MAG: tRNA (guanosine(46)-N7)-methyltransferase TrmB [Nitratireductor sp.]
MPDNDGDRPERGARSAGAFFGRRKAKPLTELQQGLHDRLLPELLIDITQPAPADPAALFARQPESVRLEIGFGGGEHLASEAARFPDCGFIGVEPFINGVAKALVSIDTGKLSNILVYDQDAARILDWLPAGSIDRVDLLYPDPWPKRRHWKRRFVSAENLKRFVRVLKPGGEFRFASDIAHYVNWTLQLVARNGWFEWTAMRASDWNDPWEGWVRTRYEQKAIREGRPPAYFIFRKR